MVCQRTKIEFFMEKEKLKEKKILFLDLDDTLITTSSGSVFPKGIWDMKCLLYVFDKVKALVEYASIQNIFIISNQGGIEAGYHTKRGVDAKINYVVECLREYIGVSNLRIDYTYCPSSDDSHPNRKPNTGMIDFFFGNLYYISPDAEYREYTEEEKKRLPSLSLMIGDASGKPGQFSDSDRKTAKNAGMDYLDVADFVALSF